MINPITNVLQGYNSTVFIYGMTGSGKTYTMFGSIGSGTSKSLKNEEDGLVSMTIDYMFN
jgi:maltoporin